MSRILKKFSSQTRPDRAVPHNCDPERFKASLQRLGGRLQKRKLHENQSRAISRIKAVLAAAAVALAVMTALWPDWIERVFLIDPDHHSGSVESNIAIACALGASLVALLARRNWRKSTAAA